MPVHAGLSGGWADLAYRTDKRGQRRVVRAVYEIRTFGALRDRLKCEGVSVARVLAPERAGWRARRASSTPGQAQSRPASRPPGWMAPLVHW